MNLARFVVAGWLALTAARGDAATPGASPGPCAKALTEGAVCEGANERALEIMRAGKLEAITVLQDVKTGDLVAFAASEPERLDVTNRVLPLSPVKLMVAASWLDHEKVTAAALPDSEKLLTDSLVSGNDNAGRRLASALREAIGTEAFLKDLERYGFPAATAITSENQDRNFWTELDPKWKRRLAPPMACHSLGKETTTKDWEDTLSLGEERFLVTALHVSRFLQAVGNGGVMASAVARKEGANQKPGSTIPPATVMSERAAKKLQVAMRAAVERGTAKSAAPILAGTGWTIGGKTGTGPSPEPPISNFDGWFAGLIFDPDGNARFTVATFVKHGGLGGGNAARISAELARYIIAGRR